MVPGSKRERQAVEQEAERATLVLRIREEAAEVSHDLREAGWSGKNGDYHPGYIIGLKDLSESVIDVLAGHLDREYSHHLIEILARAIAVPRAEKHRPLLIRLFLTAHPTRSEVKDGLGEAIAVTTNRRNRQETVDLLTNRSLGKARCMLLLALRKFDREERVRLVDELRTDPDLEHAIRVLFKKDGKPRYM